MKSIPYSRKNIRICAVLAVFSLCAGSVIAQQERPPAVPLVAHNPYFSVWSMDDKLTDGPTRHWTGSEQPMTGLVRVDGKAYRFMGGWPRELPALSQTSLKITATHTRYDFEGAGIRLGVSFFTPSIASDVDLVSRPVTYLTWNVNASDGKAHDVVLYLDVDPRIAVDTRDQPVVWGRAQTSSLKMMNIGSQDQRVLGRAGDNLRIDWGYFHLAVPNSEQATLVASSDAIRSFTETGKLPVADDLEMPVAPRDDSAHPAVALPVQVAASGSETRHVLLAYTEGYAIEYFHRRLRPYWQRNGQSVAEMLDTAESQYGELEQRATKFDEQLASDLERAGGKDYANLALLAYRQTLAAHGLAVDLDGKPLMFPKENFSNGCIATVDILYPTAPFFLLLNPELLEAQLRPVLDYSLLPRWKWPFAPHDLGTYPLANGQVYGGGERTEEDQMPVEESGNMLILVAALGHAQGDWHVAQRYWPLLTKWADYLKQKGLDPENQLSTDDFAGHLAHNANLSIKAIDALGAYAEMARALGKTSEAREYGAAAKEMAGKWEQMGLDGDHYKLAFDKPGTWSQKYNLVWDGLLNLNLFDAKVKRAEMAFYLQHLNQYGLPLDSRADYTKLDWELWTATLAEKRGDYDALLAPITKWLNETSSRVPLTDWYDTKTGKQVGFQARSVVGGLYIKALADPGLAKKWQAQSRH